VLVYETAPLSEDLTVAGQIDVTLDVATTGTDGDWVVKLIDVNTVAIDRPLHEHPRRGLVRCG